MTEFSDEEYEDIIIRAYEYMYSELNTNADYRYNASITDKKMIANFIIFIKSEDHTDNVEFILNFLESSFGYYAKKRKELKFGLKSVMLSWVIGKKAVERTTKMREDFPDFPHFLKFMRTRVGASLLSKFEAETGTKTTRLKHETYIEINQVEEDFKSSCMDDTMILEHCITGTFLYNHKSTRCVFCPQRIDCKELLKKNYPKIYNLRGY